MKGDINLLRNELDKKGWFSFRPGLGSLYVVIGIVLFEAVCYGGLFFYNKHLRSEAVKSEQASAGIDSEISKLKPDLKEAIFYQSQLSSLTAMLNRHVLWSTVFDELEKYTYQKAVFESLEANRGTHAFTVSGVTGSYTDLGKLILGLKKSPRILDVELLDTHRSDSERAGYSFTLRVSFDPQLLQK